MSKTEESKNKIEDYKEKNHDWRQYKDKNVLYIFD